MLLASTVECGTGSSDDWWLEHHLLGRRAGAPFSPALRRDHPVEPGEVGYQQLSPGLNCVNMPLEFGLQIQTWRS